MKVINPIQSLTGALSRTPRSYAILVGSGLSTAAGIPTGWGVVLDLIRRLANLYKEGCEPYPDRWYRDKFGHDPEYSDLLEQLTDKPAERQQLLKSYFEPSDDDIGTPTKRPTIAHHAISRLVKQGFIKVIITTNFDRLLEDALNSQQIPPTVLRSREDVRYALPTMHQQCTLLKVNGDYLDTRIRNIAAELSTYPHEYTTFIGQICQDHGLIICGWSGDWDTALRNVIFRNISRHFTNYWTVLDRSNDDQGARVPHNIAQLVRIKSADEFFSQLQEDVEWLDNLTRIKRNEVKARSSSSQLVAEPRSMSFKHGVTKFILPGGGPPLTPENLVSLFGTEDVDAIVDKVAWASEAIAQHDTALASDLLIIAGHLLLDEVSGIRTDRAPTLFRLLWRARELNAESSNAHKMLGEAHFRSSEFDNAIKSFENSVQRSPTDPSLYNQRGACYAALDRHEDAIIDYSHAIEIGQNDSSVYNNRALSRDSLGQYQEAMNDYDRAIEIDGENYALFFNRGCLKFKIGQFREAIGDLDRAVVLNPADVDTYVKRGLAKSQVGQIESAIDDYDRAIRRRPNYPIPYINRGNLKRNLGRIEESIEDFNRAIELAPGNALCFYNRGLSRHLLRQREEAVKDYDQAIRLDDSKGSFFRHRGHSKLLLGQYVQAIEDFDVAICLMKPLEDAESHWGRGWARAERGRHSDAIEDYDVATRLIPDNAAYYASRGQSNAAVGRAKEAIEDFDAAIRYDDGNAAYYRLRGQLKADVGRHEDAIKDLDAAIRISDDDSSYNARGVVKAFFDQHDAAIEDFDSAIFVACLPDAAMYYHNRALSKRALGDMEGAAADLKVATDNSSQ